MTQHHPWWGPGVYECFDPPNDLSGCGCCEGGGGGGFTNVPPGVETECCVSDIPRTLFADIRWRTGQGGDHCDDFLNVPLTYDDGEDKWIGEGNNGFGTLTIEVWCETGVPWHYRLSGCHNTAGDKEAFEENQCDPLLLDAGTAFTLDAGCCDGDPTSFPAEFTVTE